MEENLGAGFLALPIGLLLRALPNRLRCSESFLASTLFFKTWPWWRIMLDSLLPGTGRGNDTGGECGECGSFEVRSIH